MRTLIIRIALIVSIIGVALPLTLDRAAGEPSHATVRLAAVRISTQLLVTPDDDAQRPFACVINSRFGEFEYSSGSGTIFDPRGYVITNAHVAAPQISADWNRSCLTQISGGGGGTVAPVHIVSIPDDWGRPAMAFNVEVVGVSDATVDDLAVMRLTSRVDGDQIPSKFPYVAFGDSDMVEFGAPVWVYGYPASAGSNLTMTDGSISGLTDAQQFQQPRFKTNAEISGGNSGGTAVNADGLLIGIPSNSFWGDCRPYDTNRDGQIDEADGCNIAGGTLSVLIPSRVGHAFAEKTLGESIPLQLLSDASQVQPTEEPVPTEDSPGHGLPDEQEPSDDTVSTNESVTVRALDGSGRELPSPEGASRLLGCVDNVTIAPGESVTSTWMRDGTVVVGPDTFAWEVDWGTIICTSLLADPDDPAALLEPGTYEVVIEYQGTSYSSDPVAVNTSAFITPTETPVATERPASDDFDDAAYLNGRLEQVTASDGWLVKGTAGDIPAREGSSWAYRAGQVPAGTNAAVIVDLCQVHDLTSVPLLFGVVLWAEPTGIYIMVDSSGLTISRNDGSGFQTMSSHPLSMVRTEAGACNLVHLILENGTVSVWLNEVYVASVEGIEMEAWSVDLSVWQAAGSAPIDNPSAPVMSYQTLWVGTFLSP